MFTGKYFDYTIDNSFEGKCKELTWNRSVVVERQLCELLNESRRTPITFSQVRAFTGWEFLLIRKWFAALLTAGVFTDADTSRTQRWRLAPNFPDDRTSLAELIPPIGSIIVPRKQTGNQFTSSSQPQSVCETVRSFTDEEYGLPRKYTDRCDDFITVFSRV